MTPVQLQDFLKAIPAILRPTIQGLLDEYRVILGHKLELSEIVTHLDSNWHGQGIVLSTDPQVLIVVWRLTQGCALPGHLESVHVNAVIVRNPIDIEMRVVARQFEAFLRRAW